MPSASLQGWGNSEIAIAVLDGPVDLTHPCFAGARIERPLGHYNASADSFALAHGTHVTSIIFGQTSSTIMGIAPRCRGISIPIFHDGADSLRCSQLNLARAILIALENGAHIINISGGEFSAPVSIDGFLGDALAKCEAAGVLVVAAAGNDGCACVHTPAAVATVITVGAADRHGRPLPFSNWGAPYRFNGILAPGEAIEGAVPGGGVERRTGTSFATPIVSGLAARMLSDQMARGEQPDPLQVRQALIGTAISCDPRDQERCLAGRLNPTGASHELQEGGKGTMSIAATAREYVPSSGFGPLDAMVGTADRIPEPGAGRSPAGLNGPDVGLGPSDCGCGCGGAKKESCGCGCGEKPAPQLVYALGQIGYDFGTEARRDSVLQFLPARARTSDAAFAAALTAGGDVQPEAERVIWTLNLDQTPIYAIRPSGAFAFNGYAQILAAFKAQLRRPREVEDAEPAKQKKEVEEARPITLFSVAGVSSGSVRLMSGETVPLLVPTARGIIWWDIDAALGDFLKSLEEDEIESPAQVLYHEHRDEFLARFVASLGDFKNLFTRKYRNLGVLGRERALNFAATSAFRIFELLKEIVGYGLIIDDVAVINSPACRAGSECYDVRIRTFRESDTTASLRIFQFTLDVSDVIPVGIGTVAQWSERPKD